jgi:hypothetical protein
MSEFIDFKFIIAIIASVLSVIGFIPYARDIFKNKTKPHLYTWLIWGITQGTAAVALLYGGGKFGSISLIVGIIFVFIICLLSFKYGTKDITISDKIILALALLAIVIWWQLDNPIIAVLMVSAIDGVGYIPTIRKSFKNPWNETLSSWIIIVIVNALALIANAKYNLLTTLYPSVLLGANMAVLLVCFFRRRTVQKIY